MKEPQILVDIKIIKLFLEGDDNDRKVVRKLYPDIDFEDLKWKLMMSLFRDHIKDGKNRTYPIKYNGNMVSFYIGTTEEDLT